MTSSSYNVKMHIKQEDNHILYISYNRATISELGDVSSSSSIYTAG
jgi:hypothetical protein